MAVLAQLSDICDKSTFLVLTMAVLGGPLVGFLIGCLIGGRTHARKRWVLVAGYYAYWLVPGGYILADATPPAALAPVLGIAVLLGLFLCPCLSIILMIPARGSMSGSKSELQ
jgi:hypothetical protein